MDLRLRQLQKAAHAPDASQVDIEKYIRELSRKSEHFLTIAGPSWAKKRNTFQVVGFDWKNGEFPVICKNLHGQKFRFSLTEVETGLSLTDKGRVRLRRNPGSDQSFRLNTLTYAIARTTNTRELYPNNDIYDIYCTAAIIPYDFYNKKISNEITTDSAHLGKFASHSNFVPGWYFTIDRTHCKKSGNGQGQILYNMILKEAAEAGADGLWSPGHSVYADRVYEKMSQWAGVEVIRFPDIKGQYSRAALVRITNRKTVIDDDTIIEKNLARNGFDNIKVLEKDDFEDGEHRRRDFFVGY